MRLPDCLQNALPVRSSARHIVSPRITNPTSLQMMWAFEFLSFLRVGSGQRWRWAAVALPYRLAVLWRHQCRTRDVIEWHRRSERWQVVRARLSDRFETGGELDERRLAERRPERN